MGTATTQAANGMMRGMDELNLDDLLGKVDVSPKPVRLGGHVYHVRRDLTSAEATTCLQLINSGKELEATAMLVGDDAVTLDQALRELPHARREIASQHILSVAGLIPGGSMGESPAS